MHGTIQKGLRYGAALVLAMALCATAALAAGTEGKRLVPVGHTVGVKLFARGVVVVKLPEGGTPARTCGLKTGDVIVECGGCLLYTSPSPRDSTSSRMPSSA